LCSMRRGCSVVRQRRWFTAFQRCSFSSVVTGIRPRPDYKHLFANADEIQADIVRRNAHGNVNAIKQLYDQCQEQERKLRKLQTDRNNTAKRIAKLTGQGCASERDQLVSEGKAVKAQVAAEEEVMSRLKQQLLEEVEHLPNTTHPGVQNTDVSGDDGEGGRVLRVEGASCQRAGLRSHLEIGKMHDLFDFEAGASVTGSKFYFAKNEAVLLELALVNWCMQSLVQRGFTPYLPPDLNHTAMLRGTGFAPKDNEHNQSYRISNSDLALSGTSEITLAGVHFNKILSADQLPIKMAGFSHCFRNEAGAAGTATKGLYRVHQFSKVEMFVLCEPSHSSAMQEELVQLQQSLFSQLGLHYRVVDMPASDLGAPAHRKIDIEAWMPRHQGGSFGEISSTSNCTDFQARRLNIRYRASPKAPTQFVHTLNGTGCAVPRLMLAILEQHQQQDGSVKIPECLSPHMLGITSIPSPLLSRSS